MSNINEIMKSAIDIADQLDRLGQEELVFEIEQEIIQALSQLKQPIRRNRYIAEAEEIEVEIPEEERLMLEDILLSLQDSLKDSSKI